MKKIFVYCVSLLLLVSAGSVAQAQQKYPKKQKTEKKAKDSVVKKENKQPKKEEGVAKANPAATGTDKVVGKDAQGRTIYEGPKGGKYYINKSGKKEYVKKNS